MVQKPVFRNWMVDAYLAKQFEDIPQEVLAVVKDVAEKRVEYESEKAAKASLQKVLDQAEGETDFDNDEG